MKILVLPDVQAKPGNDFSFLTSIGNYIIAKKPDVIVNIGDFADFESLSSYDKGTKQFEGRRIRKDIEAARDAMDALLTPIYQYNEKAKRNKEKQYKPRMVLTLGNHEDRISRAVNLDPKLEGLISLEDLPYQDWEVIPFLKVIIIEGVAFCHYFTSGLLGKPVSSAKALLNKKHMSCVAGHMQGRDIAFDKRADGKQMTALIIGSCYQHHEGYLGEQGNQHWRGLYLLHNVSDGTFDECAVPLQYIIDNY
jgi:hypothetical protein